MSLLQFPHSIRTSPGSSFVVKLLFLHIAAASISFSQRTPYSFGVVRDISLDFVPGGLVHAATTGPSARVVTFVNPAGRSLHTQLFEGPGGQPRATTVELSFSPAGAFSADLDGDGRAEFIVLKPGAQMISVMWATGAGFKEISYPVDCEASAMVVADINNDRRPDILLFGKNMTGLQVLNGRHGRSLARGPLLFEDISISDLRAMDLNGDGITDIVFLHWLADEIVLFFGIGRGVFAEQISVPLEAEPGLLVSSSVSRSRTMTVGVTIPSRRLVKIFSATATGEFELLQDITLRDRPDGLLIGRINEDVWDDLIVSTGNEFGVVFGRALGEFYPVVWHGVPRPISGWTLADVDGNGRPDLILLSRGVKSFSVVMNSEARSISDEVVAYSVGRSPEGLSVRDYDGDGLLDIAVANSRSNTLSILVNRGDGRFHGQSSIAVPEQPVFVRLVTSPDTSYRSIVTSHPGVDNVSVTTFPSGEFLDVETFTIPTGPRPYVLLARNIAHEQSLELLVRYSDARDHLPSLSLLTQVGGKRQFVERRLQANIPGQVTSLMVVDRPETGSYDLFCSVFDQARHVSTLVTGSSLSGFDFGPLRDLISYPDSTSSTFAIVTGHLNKDLFADCLLLLGSPQNALGVVYGKQDGGMQEQVRWIRNLQPLNDDVVLIRDLNRDGLNDIIAYDVLKEAVVVSYQSADGNFRQPVIVAQVPGVRSMRLSPLRGAGRNDLILSLHTHGRVVVIPDPFR